MKRYNSTKLLQALLVLGIFLGMEKTSKSMTETLEPQELKQFKLVAIEKMIDSVTLFIARERKKSLAESILKASQVYQVSPQIMVAIIATESDFRFDLISHTGDISLAQINIRIWNEELKRLGREKIELKKLRRSEEYAIMRMGEILSILKKRYAGRDTHWYARYHSNTWKLRNRYRHKVGKRLLLLTQLSPATLTSSL